MGEREQIRKAPSAPAEEEIVEAPAASAGADKLKAEFDDILDEIDQVLETNAEDFVKSYIQKGGE
jgi:ubiquitin-like protein Pup